MPEHSVSQHTYRLGDMRVTREQHRETSRPIPETTDALPWALGMEKIFFSRGQLLLRWAYNEVTLGVA